MALTLKDLVQRFGGYDPDTLVDTLLQSSEFQDDLRGFVSSLDGDSRAIIQNVCRSKIKLKDKSVAYRKASPGEHTPRNRERLKPVFLVQRIILPVPQDSLHEWKKEPRKFWEVFPMLNWNDGLGLLAAFLSINQNDWRDRIPAHSVPWARIGRRFFLLFFSDICLNSNKLFLRRFPILEDRITDLSRTIDPAGSVGDIEKRIEDFARKGAQYSRIVEHIGHYALILLPQGEEDVVWELYMQRAGKHFTDMMGHLRSQFHQGVISKTDEIDELARNLRQMVRTRTVTALTVTPQREHANIETRTTGLKIESLLNENTSG